MDRAELNFEKEKAVSAEVPWWREVLTTAFGGLHDCNQQLEYLLDHLERQQ